MTIAEFSFGRQRTVVGCVGEQPSTDSIKPFVDLGYEVKPFNASELSDSRILATTDSVIFSQNPDKPTRIFSELQLFAAILLAHDCRVYVRAAQPDVNSAAMRAIVVNAIDTLELPPSGLSDTDIASLGEWYGEKMYSAFAPFVHLCGKAGDWADIARTIRDNPAGKAPNLSLIVDAVGADGKAIQLSPEHELLIRRAFWNCTSVHLMGMTNGLSGVPAFRAYAELAQGQPGQWPYLYFVKIGDRQKISAEFRGYQANALEYIPYHLGPRLRQEKCGLGCALGIIVGDYVSGAEQLRDCAKDGRAAPVIANLFNTTLWAWRQVAKPKQRSIPDFLGDIFPEAIPRHRESLIREFGATSNPLELKALFMACNAQPVLAGPIHGDLHATNVLARSTDAIVIDFEKVGSDMPLVYDAACLEGGLLVDSFIGDRRPAKIWFESIQRLYERGAFEDEVPPCHPKDKSAWYFDCVRQIRLQARQLERGTGQYAAALACALAKKACNPENFHDPLKPMPGESDHLGREQLRAAAYALAERILLSISTTR